MINKVVQFKREFKINELPDDLMLISDFAKKYGCSECYLYKLKYKGKLRLYPIGHYRVSESEALRAMGV